MKKAIGNFGREVGPVRFFVIVAAIFGMAFLLITPPFQGADEVAHFLRAYQVADGHLVATKRADGKVGGYLPSDIRTVIATTDNPSVQFYPQLKYHEGRTKAALAVASSSKKSFYDFPASATYAPTTYPLSSLGILLSRLLRLPTMAALYAARLGNLLTWIVLIGVAIYLLPSRKWVLVAVGLLPMSLFQASTLNGDAITLGTLALLLAFVLKLRNDGGRVSAKAAALILAASIVMVLSKDIMFVFLPLVFLLGKDSFGSLWRTRVVKIGLALVPLLVFCLWLVVVRDVNTTAAYDNGQNPTKQLHFVLFSPYSYINVLWNTYFYVWGDGITRSLIGTFGWADTPLSELITTIGYIGLFLLLAGGYEKTYMDILSRRAKQLLALTALLYWLAVSTALYVYYSPVGFKIIVGLQGRYYIPLLLLAIPLLRLKGIKIERTLYRKTALFLPLFLLTCSVITLYVRYFVHNV